MNSALTVGMYDDGRRGLCHNCHETAFRLSCRVYFKENPYFGMDICVICSNLLSSALYRSSTFVNTRNGPFAGINMEYMESDDE